MSIFQVLAGKYQGLAAVYNAVDAKIEFAKPSISMWGKVNYKAVTATLKLTDITSLETVESKMVNKSDAAVFGAVGAMIAGPVGMALGASLGRVQRACTFVILDNSGNEHILEGQRMWYDLIAKQIRIINVKSV